ncbi:serine/arginine repetitive matrix protein 1-like [Lepus europaeus]|uniref:serine/arginine repetitive matrix protein 1-like n=1 Tax=Lepus europaeus TaxID=9983 RepID=UPI002B45BC25|nr:serine/arginine repetitive matrix protein 1-like [Lepus europaeus]
MAPGPGTARSQGPPDPERRKPARQAQPHGGRRTPPPPPRRRRAEVGGDPGSPPGPGLPLTSAALLHAQPRAAPSAPQARRPAPARPGRAPPPPRRRPRPGPVPSRPEWAARRGGGVRGASPPRGADTRRHPTSRVSAGAHAGAARRRAGPLPPSLGDCVSDGSVGCGFGGRVTPYRSRGPGASGSWSLFEHKGPRRGAAAPPPRCSDRSPPQTLSSFRVRSGNRGLHLQAAGKQQPPDASHPARPRRRLWDSPSPQPHAIPGLDCGAPCRLGVRAGRWRCPWTARLRLGSCPSAPTSSSRERRLPRPLRLRAPGSGFRTPDAGRRREPALPDPPSTA